VKNIRDKQFVLWFNEINMKDVPLVGGKNASLGEMYQNLTKKGINIPNGFAVTSHAYWHFLKEAKIDKKIKKVLSTLDPKNIRDLAKRGYQIRQIILQAELPEDLKKEITENYKKLCKIYGSNTDVAVRSSSTAEDLAQASFAGQQETYLNIRGNHVLLDAVKKCIASLFTNRAISYREDMGFGHLKIALSVGIQEMVRSDKASAGVMFSCDTESGFPDVVVINSSWGLGENVVKGRINPDEFYVFEKTLKKGFKPIISKKLGSKETKLIYTLEGARSTKNILVSREEQKKFTLTDEEILKLAHWSCLIEDYYDRPMDTEWAKDGISGKLCIVQARPETVHPKEKNVLKEYILRRKGKVLCTGLSIGSKVGQGKVNVIKDVRNISKFKKGEILVTVMTDPDWELIMKEASAIVTDSGGRTCHSAIISRELGTPCIVGSGNATQVLKTGQQVTVSCAEGDKGYVYSGILPFRVKKTDLKKFKRPKTKIMMNLAVPERAFGLSFVPSDGVGLLREEFIFSNYIRVHPLALINFRKLKDEKVKKQIEELTYGYKDKKEFFIDKLAQGIGIIAAAFYPKEVIVRTSDFKTSEYRGLIGGKYFEPRESNPMLGWRGASRYYDPEYKDAFILECKALKRTREVFGLTNVKIMIPFCRTIEEGEKALQVMKEAGLERGKDGLEIYVMCEIPSNVVLADEFADIFDGFSIGSNDLTQLTLGVDRDSALVSKVFDERNEAVKRLISQVIKIAHKHKPRRKVGICGQAPSDFPDFARFLVECGIDSMSLNPDTVLETTIEVLKEEKRN